MSKKNPPAFFLKVRSYRATNFVSVWLICRDSGPLKTEQSFMWGEVLPEVAEAIAAATGVPVEREESPLADVKPVALPKAKLTPVEEQKSLFTENS